MVEVNMSFYRYGWLEFTSIHNPPDARKVILNASFIFSFPGTGFKIKRLSIVEIIVFISISANLYPAINQNRLVYYSYQPYRRYLQGVGYYQGTYLLKIMNAVT